MDHSIKFKFGSNQPAGLWRRDWLLSLLLVIVTLLAYLPVWNGTPIWDDDAHLTKPELRSLQGLGRIWTQPGATQQYYPLVHTLFLVEHQLWDSWPAGYHLLSILLHCASALLLVRILRQLQIPGAWLAAAIFALHPVQAESVAWISELKNTLSGMFYFGSVLAYLKFDRTRTQGSYAVALALFLFGLMSKTVIATLPLAILIIFWWERGKLSWKRDVWPLIPFFLLGTAAGVFTAWIERSLVGAQGADFNYTIIERFLIAGRLI
jgi:protein O-mannosyl-transferase